VWSCRRCSCVVCGRVVVAAVSCVVVSLLQLCRVVKVRQRIMSLLNGAHSLRGETLWSRQRLVTWCRANLATPLDNGLS